MAMTIPATLRRYGRMDYASAWNLQRALVQDRIENSGLDTLVLLEHEPVFTVGRRGRPDHCDEASLVESGYSVFHVERGGSVTYHGPGQVVGYPILRLSQFCSGPKIYMRLLEEVIILTLEEWDIHGARADMLTGVWMGQEKIAAMGVRIIRGVTMHGFALNVSVDLTPFTRIVPCGIAGCQVTSMSRVLGQAVDMRAVQDCLATVFAEVFGLEWRKPDPAEVSSAESCYAGIGPSGAGRDGS
ncbi:MAG: lipoyl(octanoyl) transferase LipB [Nitrospiraceae bacterium]